MAFAVNLRHRWILIRNALSEESVDAYFGRETVVAFRITIRFVHPEFIAEHGIEVHTAGKGFCQEPALLDLQAPGDVVLLQGKCQFGAVGLIFGQDTQKKYPFPIGCACRNPQPAPPRGVPYCRQTVSWCVSESKLPPFAVAVHAPVVTAVACTAGNDGVGFALQVNCIVLYNNHRIRSCAESGLHHSNSRQMAASAGRLEIDHFALISFGCYGEDHHS